MSQNVKLYTVKKVDKTHVNEISRHKAIRPSYYNVPEIKIVYREISRHKAIRRFYI